MCGNTEANNRFQHHTLRSNNVLRKQNASNNRLDKCRSRVIRHQYRSNGSATLSESTYRLPEQQQSKHQDTHRLIERQKRCNKIGTGKKTKHVELKHLFIQLVALNHLRSIKIHTNDNPADISTKYLSAETLQCHLTSVGLHIQQYPHPSF